MNLPARSALSESSGHLWASRSPECERKRRERHAISAELTPIDAEFLSVRPQEALGRLSRFAHHFAELTRQRHAAATRKQAGFDVQDVDDV